MIVRNIVLLPCYSYASSGKLIFVLFLLLISSRGFQQEHGQLPKVVPPSPEVSQITKIGQVSSSLHTGAASVNIPLYDLSVGTLKHSVAINYFTNGTKTTETPSRVGLNWNITAGGMISRIIHDEADGESEYLPIPADFPNQSQALLDYLFWAGQDEYDTEHDEYSISVNGVSGKFFIDANGIPRLTSHSNLRIQKAAFGFIVTTADGTKYFFGENGTVEKTIQLQLDGGNKFKTHTTAWFLTRIVSIEGDAINFFYQSISTKGFLGPSQYVVLHPNSNSTNGQCGGCSGSFNQVIHNQVSYNTYYLSSISTTNGQHISFTYGARPTGDVTGDNRLLNLSVYTSNSVPQLKYLRKYQFGYEDFPSMTGPVRKYLLKELKTLSVDDPSTQSLSHMFEYYSNSSLPEQTTLGQDYFGYANGVFNNLSFFPRPDNYVSWQRGSEGANREPNFEHTRNGALKKVIYPTGGYEEFIYEQHTLSKEITTTTYTKVNLSGSGIGTGPNEMTQNFTINNQLTSIYYNTYAWTGNNSGASPFSRLRIYRVSDNVEVYATSATAYGSSYFTPALLPGVPYKIVLTVWGDANAADVEVKYDPVTTPGPANLLGCGMRVQIINAHDPVSNKTTSKYYLYSSKTDLDKSTGVGVLATETAAGHHSGHWCNVSLVGEILDECFINLEISSSALLGGYTFNGSPIAYRTVIETDDPTLNNGGIEHHFHTVYNSNNAEPVLNQRVLNAPGNVSPELNGLEWKTVYFKKPGNGPDILKEIMNTYDFDERIDARQSNYVTRKRWAPSNSASKPISEKLRGYDIGQYYLTSGWIVLNQTKETEYDKDGLNPLTKITNYQYGNTVHTLPTRVESTNSKREDVAQVKKYPADFNTEPYITMVNNWVIAPVIESSQFKSTTPLMVQKTNFLDWFADAKVLKPELLTATKGTAATPEGLLRYHSYYANGNPKELSKENGMHYVYLWNYQYSFPVAEVRNALFEDVAYTSFEGDDKGGWTFNEANKTSTGLTGLYSFSGTITRNISASKNFIVTCWAKNGAPTLNGSPGTLMTTRNGWSLYKWNVSASSAVAVSGNQIDEVRLYPKDAQMTTYTYHPFVGISSAVDVSDKVTQYEYDVFNRLRLISDMDGNILKQFEYKYNQPY